ncbi:MAG: hypothetical protein HY619_03635 [Thaumarchaeota archaeon]|nr:hypothetical protein [Nitrososphaerota archaeon]
MDDDVTTRYLWPIGTAIAVIIVVAGLLRRMIVTQPSMEVGSKPDKEGQ